MTEGYGIRKVGPNRYREDPGRYFEDFKIGDVYAVSYTHLTLPTNREV